MYKLLIIISSLFVSICNLYSQKAYFADGYHGGIFGHYPMWQTQFMVDKLEQYPEWRINLEIEPETWDSVKVKEPIAYNNFKNIATDKRIEFTNPTFAQPYCYNISGESLIRQFEYGIKKINQHFPNVTFTTYSAEEPCFTSSLPQILKSFGFKYAVLKNPDTCWGGYMRAYGGELVNWIGPDMASILSVPRYASEELEENSTWQTKAWNNSSNYLNACFNYGIKNPVGMCFQDAGWENGPWIGHGNNIHNKSEYITWKDYIENKSIGKTNDNWHLSQEDVLVSLMWGSQVLQRIAQEVRVSENKIVIAEKINSMSNIENETDISQERFDDAWRTLLLAQHHDSWIVPYNRLNKNRTWAEEITLWTNNTNTIADNIIKNAISKFEKSNNKKGLGNIRVFNTLGIKRSEVVKVSLPDNFLNKDIIVCNTNDEEIPSLTEKTEQGVQIVFKADVPSFGYTTYRFEEKKKKQKQHNKSGVRYSSEGDCIIENDMYRIIIDPSKGGIIKSLIAKNVDNKEFADKDNKYGLGELRGFFYDNNKFYSSTESPCIITILEDNQFRTSIKLEGEIATHPYTQIIGITSDQERIDFNLSINWKNNVGIGEYKQDDNWRDNRKAFYDDRYKLNILFPTKLSEAQIYKDAPFDVCESKLENTFFNTWDSIKHNIIVHWVDLMQKDNKYGLTLLSDHTTSYSYGENFPLALTAQYSGKGLWGPDYKITQPLKMKYSIIPHKWKWNDANISTESNVWNEPLISVFEENIPMKEKSFIKLEKKGYEITAVRIENKELIVRLYNAESDETPQRISFNFPVEKVEEIELNGKVISRQNVDISSGSPSINISTPHFGIKTLRIKRN